MTITNQNIFEDLGFSAEESESLRVKSDLMISLRKLIRFSTGEAPPTRGWSLEEAALHLKTTISLQERFANDCVEELLAGKIDYLR
jgi:hypothetical protein